LFADVGGAIGAAKASDAVLVTVGLDENEIHTLPFSCRYASDESSVKTVQQNITSSPAKQCVKPHSGFNIHSSPTGKYNAPSYTFKAPAPGKNKV
jgi:hypothetical protein